MPSYPYECPDCSHEFDVLKSIANIDVEENCAKCGTISNRNISLKQSLYDTDQSLTEAYDPVFGCVVKGNNHRKRLAKERGWDEIGNEPVEKIHAHNEAQANKEIDDKWDKL